MKISISLSEAAYELLGRLVKAGDSNKSVVSEAALLAFAELDPTERARRLKETMRSKRPQTKTSWLALFWSALAEEFDTKDMAGGEQRYLMAPRPYRGFQVICDAQHDLRGEANEVVIFTDTAPPYSASTIRLNESWKFKVGSSVFDAAREVARWIDANAGMLVQ